MNKHYSILKEITFGCMSDQMNKSSLSSLTKNVKICNQIRQNLFKVRNEDKKTGFLDDAKVLLIPGIQ